MSKVVPYQVFKEKQRERRYGTSEGRLRRLRALGIPEDVGVEMLAADLDQLFDLEENPK